MLPQRCLLACFEAALNFTLVVANFFAHNNISQICYCGQISLQSAAVKFSVKFSNNAQCINLKMFLKLKFTKYDFFKLCT